ncbi:MAG: S8 family serine peptidase [Imperialibacter sp.]|uniref:S8 family serine peptidase n=1 Tax=Imperialibacter sp. TaxID=2038411 RepID=UPI003A84B5D2
MVKSRGALTILILLLSGLSLKAQVNRYIVQFTDKSGGTYSVDRPEDFLSEKAILRREKEGVPVDETDLPVSQAYLDQLAATGVEVYHTSKWMNLALIQCNVNKVLTVDALPFVSRVELVAPGARLTKGETANGRFKSKSATGRVLATTEFQNSLLSIQHMHRQGFYGEGVLIAIFDGGFGGVDAVPFFEEVRSSNRILQTYDFVTNGHQVYTFDDHGTRVFSTIGAKMIQVEGKDTTLILGTAPAADFALFVTEDVKSEYRIEEYNWLFGAEKADSLGADIIHTSVGYNVFSDSQMNYTKAQMDGKTAIITQAANLAADKGIFVVASVGNEGSNSWKKATAPADSPKVLSVGAVDNSGKLASFSSIGPTADGRIKPDVVALGVFATVGAESGSLITANGTSYSAPMVAGFVAGLIQAEPEKTREELFNDILNSGSRSTKPDTLFGYGIPDFIKATGGKILSVDDVINDKVKVYPNPFTENRLSIKINNELAVNGLSVQMFDANGKMIAQKEYNSYDINDVVIFEFSGTTPGVYFLRLSSSTFEKQVKLLRY